MPLPPIDSTSEYGVFNCSCITCLYTCNFAIDPVLAYSPANHTGVTNLMNAAKNKFPHLQFEAFSDPSAIYDEVARNYFSVYAAIEFNLNDEQKESGKFVTAQSDSSTIAYTFRFQANNMWYYFPTGNNETVYEGVTSSTDSWSLSGYLTIQNFIDTYLASQYDEVPADFTIHTFTKRYDDDIPSQHYPDRIKFVLKDGRFHLFKWIASIIVTIGLFYPMISFITQSVKEKQNKMFDLLQISGINPFSYWLSYYITGGFIYGWLYIALVYILLILPHIIGPIQEGAYFRLLVSYAPALTAFALAFGHFVPRQDYYALPCLLILLVLAVSGNYFAASEEISISAKLFVSFLCPPIGFSVGVFTIETFAWRYSGENEFDYTFINQRSSLPRLNDVCGILFFSSCLYLFIAWGFPFDLLGTSLLKHDKYIGADMDDEVLYPCDNEEDDSPLIDSNKPAILVCDGLTQVFPDNTKAVSKLSFSVHEGEVLSFLGANGAGKSTTMSMLCGTLTPSAGDAFMNGLSITRHRDSARRNIGICFQHDVIWDDITVEDHLWIIGRLRGCRGTALRESVKNMLLSLGFPEKAKNYAGSLSGGQKRRLCVGMSMVGGNKVVFLDEPTSGLDPVSRRRLWQLIQENRQDRAILLTTHFMDEADVLGDKIAIMKQGRLRAFGSSEYLKQKFGIGYMMRFSLKQSADSVTTEAIKDIISASIDNTEVVSVAGTEMSMRLPKTSTSKFPSLFATLEEVSVTLQIDSFGIETTTLEEVFLRIVNEDLENLIRDPEGSSKSIGSDFVTNQANIAKLNERDRKRFPLPESALKLLLTRGTSDQSVRFYSVCGQMPLIFLKRVRQLGRSTGQVFFCVIVPIIFAIIAALTLSKMPHDLITDMSSSFYLSGATYNTMYDTPVAYSSAACDDIVCTNIYEQQANGSCITNTVYTGNSFYDAYFYVNNQTSSQQSSTAIVVDNYNNFTVLYNATWGYNLPSVIRALNNDAVSNATSGKLRLSVATGYLPAFLGLGQLLKAIAFSLIFSLMIGSLGAGIAVVLGSEKVQLVKHLQLTSGMHKLSYWATNFIFDYAIFIAHGVVLGIALTSACDNYRVHGYNNGFIQVIGIMLLFAPAAVLRFHVLSFVITDVKVAQSFFFYGGLGIMLFWNVVAYFIVSSTSVKGNLNNPLMIQCIYTLSVIDPTFGASMLFLMQNNYLGVMEVTSSKSALASVGSYIIMAFVVNWIAMGFIIFAQESGLLRYIFFTMKALSARKQRDVEAGIELNTLYDVALTSNDDSPDSGRYASRLPDADVAAENTRVANLTHQGINKDESTILMHDLRKVYFAQTSAQKDKIAVRNMNLCIKKGESFGLLGANGAGKTTTLKIVSGLEDPSEGYAYVNGFNAVTSRTKAQRSMGVCPQFDTLIEHLTVRENLLYFARLKGISFFDVPYVVEEYMSALKIKIYENKAIINLSGGNRRKVSLAIALIGAPPTIYLDEPSTGLDPLASRLMWRLLSNIRAAGCSAMILTTHNMLECEATCTRVGIMKNGELVCLGDTQHLRSTHGSGYLLEVRVSSFDQITACKAFIEETFPNATMCDEHVTMLNYEIPKVNVAKLSTVFNILESNKQR